MKKFEIEIEKEKLNIEVVEIGGAYFKSYLNDGCVFAINVKTLINSEEFDVEYEYFFDSEEDEENYDWHNGEYIYDYYCNSIVNEFLKNHETYIMRKIWDYTLGSER